VATSERVQAGVGGAKGLNYKEFSAIFLVSEIIAGLVLRSPGASFVMGLSVVVLLYGLYRVRPVLVQLSGWISYLPLAFAAGEFVHGIIPFMIAGLYVITISEMIAFSRQAAFMTESVVGVDAQTGSLLSQLSRVHTARIAYFLAIGLALIVVSYLASSLTTYASELVVAAILLLLAMVHFASK